MYLMILGFLNLLLEPKNCIFNGFLAWGIKGGELSFNLNVDLKSSHDCASTSTKPGRAGAQIFHLLAA